MSVTPQTNEPRPPGEPQVDGLPDPPPPPLDHGRRVVVAPDEPPPSTRLEARRTQRVIHHISPWSVLKVSLLFYFCAWLVVMIAGFILWQIASGTGLIERFESFMAELLAEQRFDVYGTQILRITATFGFLAVVAGSGLTVLFTVIFNLISDVTGGIRLSVVEMETARPRRSRAPGPRTVDTEAR